MVRSYCFCECPVCLLVCSLSVSGLAEIVFTAVHMFCVQIRVDYLMLVVSAVCVGNLYACECVCRLVAFIYLSKCLQWYCVRCLNICARSWLLSFCRGVCLLVLCECVCARPVWLCKHASCVSMFVQACRAGLRCGACVLCANMFKQRTQYHCKHLDK